MPTNVGTCCCGAAYRQARKCSNNALVDVWMTTTDAATFTGAFKITTEGSGECFYFNFADATSATPGTVYATTDVTETDVDCAHCCICCTHLTVTISAPQPVAWRGVYDLTRSSGCSVLINLVWTTDPPYDADNAVPGMMAFDYNNAGGHWEFKLIDANGAAQLSGTITEDNDICPEYATYTVAGVSVECAD